MLDENCQERLILALDVDQAEDAERIVLQVKEMVGFFKIGMRLFFNYGPEIVNLVKKLGGEVFLDVKLYDIPSVVEATCRLLVKMGVKMITLHALGGTEMMRRATVAIKEENADIKVVGVTLLTSFNRKSLKEDLGIDESLEEKVLFLARKAKEAGLDGVVCSGKEAKLLREFLGKDFLLVVPGIRTERIEGDEQKRILTPEEAIKEGASYIVIGRPVLRASDPAQKIREILGRMSNLI